MLIAPTPVDKPYIIPGHSYLFKSAVGWREQQIWSEVIAYRIGKALSLPVPPCFIAYNSVTGTTGVLVEFFFGYPDEESPARLVHGVDAINSIFQSGTVGKPHTVQSNAKVTRIILGQSFGMDWWIKAYIFDTLIANTDRHTENWGFLVRRTPSGETSYQIAPLYDNGTSLGFQFPDSQLKDRAVPERLEQFNLSGKHQCGWDVQSPQPMGHFALCEKLADVYPATRSCLEEIIGLSATCVDEILQLCTNYDVPIAFTEKRATFISALIRSRQTRLSRLM